jgi:cyclohexanecarboxylate-CoA ligase
MKFDPILPPERVAAMTEAGFWPGRIITDYLEACLASVPEKTAVVDSANGERLSFRALGKRVDRFAAGLAGLGIRPGDVVSFQLPNWWQFTALHLACVRIGAVTNPLMPIFRERELGFMLDLAESRMLIVPQRFRGFDHAAMARGLRARLPGLEHLLVIGGEGDESFERRLLDHPWEEGADLAMLYAARRPDPDDVTQLLYTSGTTGEPKGAMHTANTLLANIIPYAERLRLGREDVVLMASPMAHQTGFMYGLMMPLVLQATAVLQDIWDPKRALALIAAEKVTFTMASAVFLSDLAGAAAAAPDEARSLRIFLSAGAPIPGALVEGARQALGSAIVSAWGMTENGACTLTRLDDPGERAVTTDGCALPGMETRVVDGDNRPLPPGHEGILKVRGCSNFVGYLKRPQLNNIDAEGWFDTGDLARVDETGYIRITGRAKDIIIRGGENIPVVEIEGLLFRHPAIEALAIVGMPDARLGERACAFVVPKPGQRPTLADLVAFLEEHRVARQYLPERLELVTELPRTPSGKIQKFKLREVAKSLGAGS